MGDYIQILIIYLVFSPIFFIIGVAALGYHAAIIKPSDAAIEQFLDELRFPVNSIYRTILSSTGLSPNQFLKNASSVSNLIAIAAYSIVPIIFIIAVLGTISDGGSSVIGIFWIILEFVSYILTLRFGSKLRRIQQSILPRQKSDLGL